MPMFADPYAELRPLVAALRYKPDWRFALRTGITFGSGATADDWTAGNTSVCTISLTWPPAPVFLLVSLWTPDSSDPERKIDVTHTFAAPPSDYGDAAWWRRWLLDRILDVERHEACEFFELAGERPFYPEHGTAAELYAVRERPA